MHYGTVRLYQFPVRRDSHYEPIAPGVSGGFFSALVLCLPVSMGLWYGILLGIGRLAH